MKKLKLLLISLFAITATQEVQAYDFTAGFVALLLGSAKNLKTVTNHQSYGDDELERSAKMQSQSFKAFNTPVRNLYIKTTNDDSTAAKGGNFYYALRGSYNQPSKDCDDCGGTC